MADNTLKIKHRSEDNHRGISVRIEDDLLKSLNKLAKETNISRNELINLILKHGVEHIKIE